jgi:hypothetical protein
MTVATIQLPVPDGPVALMFGAKKYVWEEPWVPELCVDDISDGWDSGSRYGYARLICGEEMIVEKMQCSQEQADRGRWNVLCFFSHQLGSNRGPTSGQKHGSQLGTGPTR